MPNIAKGHNSTQNLVDFEISCSQDFNLIYEKGHNSAIASLMEKKTAQSIIISRFYLEK